jgi:hypothetical protein
MQDYSGGVNNSTQRWRERLVQLALNRVIQARERRFSIGSANATASDLAAHSGKYRAHSISYSCTAVSPNCLGQRGSPQQLINRRQFAQKVGFCLGLQFD